MTDKRQPTILHVLNSDQFSGAENVVVGLIRENGGVYCSPDGTIRESLKQHKIKYIGIKKLTIGQIKPVINSLRPDIIYAHDFRASLLMGHFFGKKYDVVSYVHQNPGWLDRMNLKTVMYKKVMKNFRKIVVVSDSIGERKLFKGPMKVKVAVQYNKVDEKRINELARENFSQTYDLCFVGRLCDVKQPEHFVDLISKLKVENPNVSAVMVGDGELMGAVKRVIREYKLEKNIDVVGFQKNPYKYMNAARIVVLTSRSEGLPMVVLEATTLGKCFLSYEYPTMFDVFTTESQDVEFLCKDMSTLSRTANTLLQDDSYYRKVVNFQKACVANLYDSDAGTV